MSTHEVLIESILRRVAELPDRTSPEDWPEAMLVTHDELEAILVDVLQRDRLIVELAHVEALLTDVLRKRGVMPR